MNARLSAHCMHAYNSPILKEALVMGFALHFGHKIRWNHCNDGFSTDQVPQARGSCLSESFLPLKQTKAVHHVINDHLNNESNTSISC